MSLYNIFLSKFFLKDALLKIILNIIKKLIKIYKKTINLLKNEKKINRHDELDYYVNFYLAGLSTFIFLCTSLRQGEAGRVIHFATFNQHPT